MILVADLNFSGVDKGKFVGEYSWESVYSEDHWGFVLVSVPLIIRSVRVSRLNFIWGYSIVGRFNRILGKVGNSLFFAFSNRTTI